MDCQEKLYHGSRQEMRPGNEVTPDHPSATSTGTSGWVYATPLITLAWLVAEYKPHEGQPRVYEVTPTGRLRPDPEMKESYRSRSPLTVVRELSTEDIESAMVDRWGKFKVTIP